MGKLTLFAYAQGSDLDGVAEVLETKLDAIVSSRTWVSKDVWVVNQRFPPDWDLGLNLEVAAKRTRPKEWIDDVAAIATALGSLHRETGRQFVIGIHDAKTDTTTDLFVIDGEKPDIEKLRAAVSAAT